MMNNILLAPGIKLMQGLRLLPKFIVLTIIFVTPLVLVSLLLLMELDKSIDFTRQERVGVSHVRKVQELIKLTQQHRALHHMFVMGNASAGESVQQVQKNLNQQITVFETMRKVEPDLYAGDAWESIRNSWAAVQEKSSAAKDRGIYKDHTALIAGLFRFSAMIADRSRLTHDPVAASNYLAGLFAQDIPQITEGLSEIAGRGAAYIDSGLMEANEEVLLGSTVLVTRRDLAAIPDQIETLTRENPQLKQSMTAVLATIPAATAYLDRAGNEVLNTLNQSSGTEFAVAGQHSIDALYAAASSSADVLDKLLQTRMENAGWHRNMIMLMIFCALAIAAYFLLGFYVSFSAEVRRLSAAVMRAASGDLSQKMRSDGRDEIGQLLNAFGGMNDGLTHLVQQVRMSSDTIALASHEIASGNFNLSARTEEQASSLEQTSAAMEELTSAVRQNTAHAQHASRLVKAASGIAERGGSAVSQVVDTMLEIRQSSQEISEIIGVVDSIAFQTNILALNAAVEAARAGPQGRGFAVVAAEVRGLAQRSAVAAREIKALIGESVEKVDIGSRQVNAAGSTMQEILQSVSHVSTIMEEISQASIEQQSGIEHINQAIVQMDDITQQNAALVEESAAAAESMREQTGKLEETVAVFKLVNDVGDKQKIVTEIGKSQAEVHYSMANKRMPLYKPSMITHPEAAALSQQLAIASARG
jgi:methyl-accepting chemotaxis protein